MSELALPEGYEGVKIVRSFDELVSTPFSGSVNALCWRRALEGDFGEVTEHLARRKGITTVNEAELEGLPLSAAGKAAVAVILDDLRQLRDYGAEPVLDCIDGYPRDEPGALVPTDVYSFHADSATVPTDTFLCTYHGRSSEVVPNAEAQRRVDDPATRAALLEQYGGEDDQGFAEYLEEHFYDLHFAALPGARIVSFGAGNLWRIAVAYPGSPVQPCIHRAPETFPGDSPRLLLIS